MSESNLALSGSRKVDARLADGLFAEWVTDGGGLGAGGGEDDAVFDAGEDEVTLDGGFGG